MNETNKQHYSEKVLIVQRQTGLTVSTSGMDWMKSIIDLSHHVENLKEQMETFWDMVEKVYFWPLFLPLIVPYLENQIFARHEILTKRSALLTSINMYNIEKKQRRLLETSSKKSILTPVLTPFCPISRDKDFSHTWDFH